MRNPDQPDTQCAEDHVLEPRICTPGPHQGTAIRITYTPRGATCVACDRELPDCDTPRLAFATDDGHPVCDHCAAHTDPDAHRALGVLHRIHNQVDELYTDLPYLGYSNIDPPVHEYLATVARGILALLDGLFPASTFFRCDTCGGWFDYAGTGGRIPAPDAARYCDHCHPDN